MSDLGSRPLTAQNRSARRDLAQVQALLDRLEQASPTMARRAVPRMRRRAFQLTDDLNQAVDASPEDVANLVTDALTAYEGALVRREGLDGGLCDIAEKLLDEIAAVDAGWAGIPVILGTDDSFGPLSGVIHLRYPTSSVWAVPLVAHELGHHAAFAMDREVQQGMHRLTSHPVSDLLERGKAAGGISAWSHLNELFADVFATWTTGPAYACSLVTLRLDRVAPAEGTFQHPAPNARVRAVLRTLERIDDNSPFARPNAALTERLAAWWARHAGPPVVPTEPSFLAGLLPDALPDDAIERHVDEFLSTVQREVAGARHQTTEATRHVEEILVSGEDIQCRVTDPIRVLDVLTAVWRIRMNERPAAPLETLGRRAREICTRLVRTWVPSPRKAT